MAKSSKNVDDLLVTINSQEEQLSRYKKRLQDVVVAHKKLMAEKTRLEETLKTVTDVKSSNVAKDTVNDNDAEKNIDQVTKLAQSLSALSDEKCQMEAQFQLERKHLNENILQLEEKLKDLSASHKTVSEETSPQISLENRQRELELSSNIRELQKIINEERRKRENKEFFISKLKEQLKLTQEKLNEAKESENILRSRLTETKTLPEDDTSPKVLENLKSELKLMQEQHNFAVQQEQMRTLKAEEKMRKLSVEHENRVSKLEQKLAQLSDLASKYDRHRQEDQQTILKLKNRLMHLELENSNVKCEDDRIAFSEETMFQQLQHIKHQLMQNCQTSFQLNKLKEILCDGLDLVPDTDAKKYKELFFQLKKQYEECQRKNSRDSTGDENMTVSKQKLHNLRNKISELESANTSLQQQLDMERENTDKVLEDERHKWKLKMNALESEYHNKLIIMECELEKQRERTTNMLDEKEKQLQHLQQRYFPVYEFSDESSSEKKKTYRGTQKRQNSTLIYYLEDSARKEADINRLRKINNELEERIHEMEKDHYYQTQLYTQLQGELERLQKEQDGNEDTNKKYLKNVIMNYLNATDTKMKSHMLNAIFTILKFSDTEMNRVLKLLKK